MIKSCIKLEINTKNIIENYNFFKSLRKNLIIGATIKANAYGLGDKKIFDLLIKHKCKNFFVATIEEGIRLNNKKKDVKIYILNGIQDYNLKVFNKYNLIPIINSNDELNKVMKQNIKFGLHIDTGINRLGISFNELQREVFNHKCLCLIISHLSSADEKTNEYNRLQKSRFKKITDRFKKNKMIFSLANSNGSVLSRSYLFNMIRPGIGLYGGSNNNVILEKKLKPVVKLCAKIIQIKKIKKNEFVGYNQTFKTKKEIKVAIIGIGYADGIPRILSNKGNVYYKDEKFRIIGRISMDSLTVDITNSKNILKVGKYLELINYKYGIDKMGRDYKTISNEVITSIGSRVKRIYVK